MGLSGVLTELGVAVADVLAHARLPARLLDGAATHLEVSEYFALWAAIREVSGDPNVGLHLAQRVRADHTEPLFLAMFSATHLADALTSLASYKRQLSPERLVVVTSGDVIRLEAAWPATHGRPPAVLVDAEFGFIVELARRATRDASLSPRRVSLQVATLEPAAQHAGYFRGSLELASDLNALEFSTRDAHRPFFTHNPELLAAIGPWLSANTPPDPDSVVEQVRTTIAQRLRGRRPTVQEISRELAMSQRSLQRALATEQTSFRSLLDEVRNHHARGYLQQTRFSDPEIAYLLGFDDPNSFYRSFRAWNGVSPGEFRAQSGAS